MSATATVTVTYQFAAPPEQVFDAWLNPGLARHFLFATPSGTMLEARIDARVGGHFVFIDRRPDTGDVRHEGTWLEIDRPRRLVFEFAVPAFDPTRTRITIEIVPEGAGSRLTLTHEGVLETYLAQTQHGWGMILEALARTLKTSAG